MLTIVCIVFLHLMQNVEHGFGPRTGVVFVKATKVVEGIASGRQKKGLK